MKIGRWLCALICILILAGMIYFISSQAKDHKNSLTKEEKQTVTQENTISTMTNESKEIAADKEKENETDRKSIEEKAKEIFEQDHKENSSQNSINTALENENKDTAKNAASTQTNSNETSQTSENEEKQAQTAAEENQESLNDTTTTQEKQKETENQAIKKEQETNEVKTVSKEAKQVDTQIKEILAVNKIEFETGKSTLTAKGEEIVAKIAVILKEHPDLKIEIAGYTDSVGDAAKNQKLSEDRAKSVKEALIKEGISPDRLVAKGYGESKPLKNVKGESQENRRVEFIIIEE